MRRFSLFIPAIGLCLFTACSPSAKPGTAAYFAKQLDDPSTAITAIGHLAALKSTEHADAIAALLRKPGPWQPAAAAALGDLKATQHRGLLLSSIDPSAGTGSDKRTILANQLNRNAAKALAALGDQTAVPMITALLRSPVATTREGAIEALAILGGEGVAQALSDVATNDSEPFIQKTAVIALGNLGDPLGVPALIEAMYRERPGISFYREARMALVQIGSPAILPLQQTFLRKNTKVEEMRLAEGMPIAEGTIEAKAGFVLGTLRDQSFEPNMAESLARIYGHYLQRTKRPVFASVPASVVELCFALENLKQSSKTITLLGRIANEEDIRIREAATHALTKAHAPDAAKILIQAAQNSQGKAQEVSLAGASLVAKNENIAPLQALIEKSTLTPERRAEFKAQLDLSIKCASDISCWQTAAKGSSAAVRERAVVELALLNQQPDIMAAMQDTAPEVRTAAIAALADHVDAVNIQELVKVQDSWKDKVQFSANSEEIQYVIARAKKLQP